MELTYGLVQFAGLTIEYDGQQPIGHRLKKASVNGKKIKDKRLYTIACSAYVASGGDGFTMLKNGEVVQKGTKKIIDYLLDYIKVQQEIVLPAVGRQVERTR